MWKVLRKNRGLTLIELVVAMALSSILIAGLYRTYVRQQKTYTVETQVVDMQQNVRVALNTMVREIRMAGFGGVGDVLALAGGVNGSTNVITAGGTNSITIVGGFTQISTLAVEAPMGTSTVILASSADAAKFDNAANRYISIGGVESNTVKSINGAIITLDNSLRVPHKLSDPLGNPVTIPVYKIEEVTYQVDPNSKLTRDAGAGPEVVADNVQSLQFKYFDADGVETDIPLAIRMVNVQINARTESQDPEYKGGALEGYRERVLTSNIQVRNMTTSP